MEELTQRPFVLKNLQGSASVHPDALPNHASDLEYLWVQG